MWNKLKKRDKIATTKKKIRALIKLMSRYNKSLSATSSGVDVTYNIAFINIKRANSSLAFP